jgi:hypothetical protein
MSRRAKYFAMCLRGRPWVRIALVVALQGGAAFAASPTPPAPSPTAPAAPPTASPSHAEEAPLEVKGFRSAVFGANEAEVRAAIQKDFGVAPDAIKTAQNFVERTTLLTVRAADVLPEGGMADIAYTLGHTSKKLVQVTVTWSKLSDDKITPEKILEDGESLRNYFQGESYAPSSVMTNAVVGEGVVLFRGADAQGHTTVLLLRGTPSGDKTTGQKLTPTSLALYYLADSKNPDIYRIPKGKF